MRMLRGTLVSLALALAACGRAAPNGVNVPPPVIITAVVTATGGAPASNGTPASGASTSPANESPTSAPPAATPAYPPPLHASVGAVYEEFEHGFMIYLSDRETIWVCLRWVPAADGPAVATQDYGTWLAFPDIFKDGQPETDPNIVPPANFQQPKRGFGQVWRDNQNVRDALGWALDWERPYTAHVVDFSIGKFDGNGNFSPSAFYHTVTTDKNTTIYIDENSGLWKVKNS